FLQSFLYIINENLIYLNNLIMSQRKILFGLLFCILLPGCSSSGSNSKSGDLKKHRQTWQKQHISNYQFDISVDYFCPSWLFTAIVIVRDDTVSAILDPKTVKILRTPNSKQLVLDKLPHYYPTISTLFDTINKSITLDYAHLDVEYDS